jgi:hypothetical protein
MSEWQHLQMHTIQRHQGKSMLRTKPIESIGKNSGYIAYLYSQHLTNIGVKGIENEGAMPPLSSFISRGMYICMVIRFT